MFDIALNGQATQSSHHADFMDLSANNAISGVVPLQFAFHTAIEPNPWWRVDIEEIVPIHSIVLHNRRDGFQNRAADCAVSVSIDGKKWFSVYTSESAFGSSPDGIPLTIALEGRVLARHVRVQLNTTDYLHLSQVQVFVDKVQYQISRVRSFYRLPNIDFLGDHRPQYALGSQYVLTQRPDAIASSVITSIRLVPIGRFGNQLTQLINAICFAKRFNIRRIQPIKYGLFKYDNPILYDGISISLDEVFEPGGVSIAGDFYYDFADLRPALNDVSGLERYKIAQQLVKKEMLKDVLTIKSGKAVDELTIHIRSGDLFANQSPNRGYVQPPLSFYTLVIKRLIASGQVRRLHLVFEDKGNPCIDALIEFSRRIRIPVRTTSGTIENDISELINSRRLMFGIGTFGKAICQLSSSIEEVYYYETIHDYMYYDIPSVGRAIPIRDKMGGYIATGDWRNSPEQRNLMISYPEDALEIGVS